MGCFFERRVFTLRRMVSCEMQYWVSMGSWRKKVRLMCLERIIWVDQWEGS